jgi:hypothetical protein
LTTAVRESNRDIVAARLSWERARQVADALPGAVATDEIILDRATEPGDLLTVAPAAAHDIALRLGYRDAFPANDSRLRLAADMLGFSLADAAPAWRSWRALAATHLIRFALSCSSEAA